MKSQKLQLIIVAVILSVLSLFSPGFPSVGFAPPVSYSSTNPAYVALADMNGDGTTDFAVANWSANTVTVFLGNGDGTFTARTPVSVGVHPNSIATGFFNDDANLDLAVANGGGVRDVTIMLGNGSGGFSSVTSLNVSVGGYPFGDADINYIVAGDFDNDGETDLALSKNTGYEPAINDHIKIMKGNGSGGFTPLSSINVGIYPSPAIGPWVLATGYFNGDTNLDLAVTLYASGTVKILLGDGSGGFTGASGSPITVGTLPIYVANADLNADGEADLIVTNNGSNTLTVLLGNGDGTFTEASESPIVTGTSPGGIIAAQMGPDNNMDLIVTNAGASTVSIFEGNGDGTFQAKQDFATGAGPGSPVVGDFDGDGKTDLAVANSSANTVSVFLQRGCTVPSSGLISWWPGDGNAMDIAGSNDGTPVNGATYAQGINGQAYSFDGVNDYVELPAGVGGFGNVPFTVEFWMYAKSDPAGDAYLIGKSHPNGGQGWDVRFNDNSVKVVGVNGWDFNIVSDGSAALNAWHHIAVSSTDSLVTLYIDGVVKGTSGRSVISTTDNPLRLAFTTNYGGTPFNGLLDEVRIFERALVGAEIRAIYNAGGAGICKSCDTPPSGMVSWWKGEGNAADSNGTHNGTLQNGVSFADGVAGQGFSLDGVDDHVDLGSWFNYQSFTVEMWVNPAPTQKTYANIIDNNHTGSRSWVLQQNADSANEYGWGVSLFTLPADQWSHLVIMRDGVTKEDKVFRNGELVATATTWPADINYDGTQSLLLGMWGGSCCTYLDRHWNGLMDEVRVFNRALSSSEIQSIYRCAPDMTPNAFTFADVSDADTGAVYTSNTITVDGLNIPANISIVGGEYEINGSDSWTTSSGTVANGDKVKVRLTSSDVYGTQLDAFLSIGTGSDTFSVTTGAPDISAVPDSLSFGSVVQGVTSSAQEVTISNSGSLDVEVTAIGVTGTDSGMFNVETGGTSPCASLIPTIGPGSSCTINVTFTPASAGGKSASLEITSDDPDTETTTVSLTGTGIVPIINVTPSPHDFGNAAVGTTWNSQEFTIANDGTADLVVSGISITGGSGAFVLDTGTCKSTTPTVSAGANCKVSITFSPVSAGATSATLKVGSNDPDMPDKDASISGTGYRNLSVTIQPADSGTVASSPAGINCGPSSTDCDENITVEDQAVDLTATPAAGNYFLKWEGSATGTANPTTVTMDGTKSVTAVFATNRNVCPACTHTTIQAAIDASQTGDTIKVALGTYNENLLIDTNKEVTISGGWNSDMSAQTADPLLTIVDGDTDDDGLGDGSVLSITAPSTISVGNMTFQHGSRTTGGGILAEPASGSIDLTLREIVLRENSADYGGAIFARSGTGTTVQLSAVNTLIIDNYGDALKAISNDSLTTASLTNCTITDNSSGISAMSYGGGTTNVSLLNCIVQGNEPANVDSYNGALIAAIYSDIGAIAGPLTFTDMGLNINEDPVFVNPAKSDYRPNSDSPVVDKGNAGAAPAYDIIGQERGVTADMGAYEHQPTVATAIKLLSLNGGEVIDAGMPYNITWEAPASAQSFKVLYSLDDGLTWVKAVSADPGVSGNIVTGQRHFRWDVPMQPKNKKKNKIKVIGYTGANATGTKVGADVSDLPFMLRAVSLVRPNGPEPLHYGESYLISWETTEKPAAAVSSVVLSYTTDGGLSWKAIATLPDNPGSHTWTVPTFTKAKAKCRVKVDLYSGTTKVGSDTSDSFFTVGP